MNIFYFSTSKIKNFLDNDNEFFFETLKNIDNTIDDLYESYISEILQKNTINANKTKSLIKMLNNKKIELIKKQQQQTKQTLLDISNDISENIENIDKLQLKINKHYIKIINQLQEKLDKKNIIIKQKIAEINEMYFYDLY